MKYEITCTLNTYVKCCPTIFKREKVKVHHKYSLVPQKRNISGTRIIKVLLFSELGCKNSTFQFLMFHKPMLFTYLNGTARRGSQKVV